MARNFIAASSQYLEIASGLVTATPLTVSCWFYPAAANVTYDLIIVGDAAGSNYWALVANNAGTVPAISAAAFAGSTESSGVTTNLYAARQWSHACGVFASTSSKVAYLNGPAGKGTNATAVTPTGIALVDVGGYHVGGSVFGPMNGQVAEVAIWNAALADAEVATLAGQTDLPLYDLPTRVRPGNLVAYWPLRDGITPEYDRSGGGHFLAAVGGPKVFPQPAFLQARYPPAWLGTSGAAPAVAFPPRPWITQPQFAISQYEE